MEWSDIFLHAIIASLKCLDMYFVSWCTQQVPVAGSDDEASCDAF